MAFVLELWDLANKASVVTGLLGGGVLTAASHVLRSRRERRLRRERVKCLAVGGAVPAIAVCVGVGGRKDPLPEVERYVRERLPGVQTIHRYQAPNAGLDDPHTAAAVVDDLLEGAGELGRADADEIHLFYAGMAGYPFVLGAAFANWRRVVVYHYSAEGYVPLYDHRKDRRERLSKPAGRWDLVAPPRRTTDHIREEAAVPSSSR